VEPGTVLLSRPHGSRNSVWNDVYRDARRVLEQEKDARGRALSVVDLMEPDLEMLECGREEDIVASYVNYYLANGAVVAPSFGDEKADKRCIEVLEKVFPSRKVMDMRINMLPRVGGGIHCATQQLPLV